MSRRLPGSRRLATLLVFLGGLDARAEDPAAGSPAGGDAPVFTTVVTATRLARPLRDVPATVVVLPRPELERSPALSVDTTLRAVPSVGTFRRTTSLIADPSSQGLNLRGMGPSGTSRALLLVDGFPVNDPFGGWIYWRALPSLSVDHAEIVLGGTSALYGTAALGGVVELFTRSARQASSEFDLQLGSLRTDLLAGRLARAFGPVGLALEAQVLTSAGYTPVVEASRGAIDRAAPSASVATHAQLDWEIDPSTTARAQAAYFRETENGGTRFTESAAEMGRFGLRLETDRAGIGHLDAHLHLLLSRFDQTRARVASDRSSESRAAAQDVPSDEEGLGIQWTPRLPRGASHLLTFGVDVRRVAGVSSEALFPASSSPAALAHRRAGGQQEFAALYAEDVYTPLRPLELVLALRLDAWRHLPGFQEVEQLDGARDLTRFDEKHFLSFDPRLGVRWHALPWLTWRGSVYRAFRAPTLNELYRPFQVGTVLTAANPALQPETLWGGELGLQVVRGSWVARATGFWSSLNDPVVNVTLAQPLADGSQRQRLNLGRADIRGAEAELEGRIAPWVTLSLAYTFADARVARAPAMPALVGKLLAQDPQHRATLACAVDVPGILRGMVQLRYLGPQFEDDLNTSGMAGVFLLDASLSRPLTRSLELFAAAENLTHRRYLVSRAGVDTLGPPLMVRVGLRLRAGDSW